MIVTEVLAVEPRGRISASDLGIWSDDQVEGLRRMVEFAHSCDVRVVAQLAHAGRKSHILGSQTAPSDIPFDSNLGKPSAMTHGDMVDVIAAYGAATRRAEAAGFDAVQVHAANGYLLHEYLAPIANAREDEYGGSMENRFRFPLEVVAAVRKALSIDKPLLYRMCADDILDGGVTQEESLELARRLKEAGVDLIDVTTGNIVPGTYKGPVYPGYQVRYAEAVRNHTGVRTCTTGSITSLELIEEILGARRVDLVCLGRELMRNPFWAIEAARSAGIKLDLPMPTYARGTGPFERGF